MFAQAADGVIAMDDQEALSFYVARLSSIWVDRAIGSVGLRLDRTPDDGPHRSARDGERHASALAHTANQVFLSLVQELTQQGLSGKVIADMFGLALRTYHHRVQRLTESATFRGRSIWEAVFEYVQERGPVLRGDVLRRWPSTSAMGSSSFACS